MTKTRLPQRHDILLSRLVDLAYEAREYAKDGHTEHSRMHRLRSLAESALKYSAAVRTIARAK